LRTLKKNKCQGISYTYNEPTIFLEYALDTAKLAQKEGLYNTLVTNGYMTPEAIKVIAPHLDAVTVDIKGAASSEFYKKLCKIADVNPIF
jgi:pyruvate formate lyase activating enzyme